MNTTQNTLLTSQLIVQKLDKALKFDSTFLNFSSKEFQGDMSNSKEFLPGTNISVLMLQYPRAYFGQNLNNINTLGYTSQVYNITLENRGFINVMQSYDSVQTAFQMGKFIEQFIYPTHKTIRKAVEYYTIEKLNRNVTHVPISSCDYKNFVTNYLKGLSTGNTIGTAPMVNYMNRMDAYMHAMNLAHDYAHFMSPMAVASVMQSLLTLIAPSTVEGIAEDAKVGKLSGREIVRSSELVNNTHIKKASPFTIDSSVVTNSTKISGTILNLDDPAQKLSGLATHRLVFPQQNTFNLQYIGIPVSTKLTTVPEIINAAIPKMWSEGETLCIYAGEPATVAKDASVSVPKVSCIGFTNQISQVNVSNYFTLTMLAAPSKTNCYVMPATSEDKDAFKESPITHMIYVKLADSQTNMMPLGEITGINSKEIANTRNGGAFIPGNSASTFRSTYLGPAISNLPNADIDYNNELCNKANQIGWNFQSGRIGPFNADTLQVVSASDTVNVKATNGVGEVATLYGPSAPALVTPSDFMGVADTYTYKSTSDGISLIPEWEFTISKETLYIINPGVTQMHGIDSSITQDPEARLKYRSSIFGFIESSVNLWRIDTLIGVGVTPIYNMTFPMPVGLSC